MQQRKHTAEEWYGVLQLGKCCQIFFLCSCFHFQPSPTNCGDEVGIVKAEVGLGESMLEDFKAIA